MLGGAKSYNMANNNITKTVVSLVKNLSIRNRDIVSRRFGLKSGRKETLESIGKSYGITRERVRQIEEFSLGQLSKVVSADSEIAKYVSLSKELLNGAGGVMKESELFKAFSGSDKESAGTDAGIGSASNQANGESRAICSRGGGAGTDVREICEPKDCAKTARSGRGQEG